jgi:dye decolorizing peroxidase
MTDANPTITRRGMLAAGGAAILGAAGGYALGVRQGDPPAVAPTAATPVPSASPAATTATTPTTFAFFGEHQPGIETPPALLQTFIGLDLVDPTPSNADAALRLVSDDAARLMAGEPALGDTEAELAAHPDGLTVSVGLGRPLFLRTGLADAIPAQLAEIPAFSTDQLDDAWSQTDLLLQVASDNAVTLAHTVRMLTKDLSTLAVVRWVQPGFRSSAPAVEGGDTTRNLMGQVDGTVNPAPGSPQFTEVVWIDDDPAWLRGGTVLVLRRIRMHLDTWEVLDRPVQESVMGRMISTGAPLGGTSESDPVPFDAVDANGLPVIPQDAHIRVAHASTAAGMILRRPYSYDNGMHDGTNDVGLLFAAYMRDPATSFIPMQQRIAEMDAFNEWNTTIGSAAYVFPAGAAEGGYLAQGLFA